MMGGILLAYQRNTYGVPGAIIEYIMTGYYDIVLALIPMALLGIGGALLVAGVPQAIAVSLAGTTAVGMIGHAIFVNGPVESPTSTSTDAQTTATSGHAPQAD
jgi:hypothetical protein